MPVQGTITLRDFSGESTTIRPNVAAGLAPADALARLNAVITPAFNDGFILGLPQRGQVNYKEQYNFAGPITGNAQREVKWLVTVVDQSEFLDPPTNSVANPYFGRQFSLEFPTANISVLPAGTDILPLTDAIAANTVAAIAANFQSPTGGTLGVLQIQFVGRRL